MHAPKRVETIIETRTGRRGSVRILRFAAATAIAGFTLTKSQAA